MYIYTYTYICKPFSCRVRARCELFDSMHDIYIYVRIYANLFLVAFELNVHCMHLQEGPCVCEAKLVYDIAVLCQVNLVYDIP